MNYDKIHYFEYDTELKNDKELLDNSILLDEYDYVIYNSDDTHKIAGGFLSFKSNCVIDEWKKIDDSIFEKTYFGVYPKVPENILFSQISKQKKYIEKNYHDLKKNGLLVNTKHENRSNWNVPFFDPRDSKLKFISYNETSDIFEIKVFVNNTLHNLGTVNPSSWKIVDLLENFYDVESIKVFKNDSKVLDLNFKTIESKDKFRHYNSALTNHSLQI